MKDDREAWIPLRSGRRIPVRLPPSQRGGLANLPPDVVQPDPVAVEPDPED